MRSTATLPQQETCPLSAPSLPLDTRARSPATQQRQHNPPHQQSSIRKQSSSQKRKQRERDSENTFNACESRHQLCFSIGFSDRSEKHVGKNSQCTTSRKHPRRSSHRRDRRISHLDYGTSLAASVPEAGIPRHFDEAAKRSLKPRTPDSDPKVSKH